LEQTKRSFFSHHHFDRIGNPPEGDDMGEGTGTRSSAVANMRVSGFRCTKSTIVVWVASKIYIPRCTKMASAGTTPFYGREHELLRLQELAGKKTASLEPCRSNQNRPAFDRSG
jgi:hypothetical protein